MKRLRDGLHSALGGLSPVFWTLVAGMFVNRLANFVGVFLALYLVRERGFGADEAGRVVALYGVGLLVASPLGGTLADAIGRRTTMLLSLSAGALVVGTIGFLHGTGWIAAFAFLAAATSEMYRPAMNAAIADVVPAADRSRAWGLSYWAANLGWTFGLALGGALAAHSFIAVFLADAATSLVFATIVARKVPETRPNDANLHSPLGGLGLVFRDRAFVSFLVLVFLSLVVFVQFQLAVPVDMSAHGIGPGTFAVLLSLNGLGVVLLQPISAAWLPVGDGSRRLAASALLIGAGFGVYALAGPVPPLVVYATGIVLWTLGEVSGFPVAAAIVADLAPPALRGRYQGVFSMTWGVAFTVAPILGGEVLTRFGGRALWLLCLVIGASVAVAHLATAGQRLRRMAALAKEAAPDN